ncbi:hypothetical protein Poli38472_003684 [Pythium oligandrum]|uniref:WW domain-containing protein n=1 Tax=Pythium oligandrum TaxID=41045 RepID=A0A8K1CLW0_PYTOL|nr:hypothetical protein Poli38472_003684 [Pythium oligandrum]|eukprot:TMW65919.1 hypothetical protein Poli38472_003684 [Pythium oligandrum]
MMAEADEQVPMEDVEDGLVENKEVLEMEVVISSLETSGTAWIEQYDPTAQRVYYYNAETGASQWDRPEDFVEGAQDEKVHNVVRIQSAYRSKKARDRVKELMDSAQSTERSVLDGEGDREVPPQQEEVAGDVVEQALQPVWREHFDPNHQQFYYHNVETGEVTWEKPESALLVETDRLGDSATRIQCAFRKRTASRATEIKRTMVHNLTDATVIDQKMKELMHAVDEIHSEVEARKRSLDAMEQYEHLYKSVESWTLSMTGIRDRVLDHAHHGELVKQLELSAEKIRKAEEFQEAMAQTRSECLSLLRSIFVVDSYFLEVDVARVNRAMATYISWKQSDVCTLTDSKLLKVIQADEINTLVNQTEKILRRATGLTDFTTGATSIMGKSYSSWRSEADSVVAAVARVESCLKHKQHLLEMYHQNSIERAESGMMEVEDERSMMLEATVRREKKAHEDHVKFLQLCRERWTKGLQQRQEDEQQAQRDEKMNNDKLQEDCDRRRRQNEMDRAQRGQLRLSIWEATRAGHAVDIIRTMVFAEMRKARQSGYDFVVRDAKSDNGESLVQIACWCGHGELVSFFLDQGADLLAVDSFYNGFTLLHDAARRGHSQIIRLLIERGLKPDVQDRSGDTPLHWAARMNQYEAVHTIIGAHMHRPDPSFSGPALRALRTKNQRGRTPLELTKSECIKRLLQAFDEGRLPFASKISLLCGPLSSVKVFGHTARPTMTATSALERLDQLIIVYSQRLSSQVLQRLSVADILGEHASYNGVALPTKEELGITAEQEPAYRNLVKFIRLHEPTGQENDVAHKANVVRCLALKLMLQECRLAKLPHIQVACAEKVLTWFEEATASEAIHQVAGSASTPILPPRMSPKKPMSANAALGRSSSQGTIPNKDLDIMAKASITHKLEKYRMPNLRASHIRRVAQLRERGTGIDDEVLAIPDEMNDDDGRPHDDHFDLLAYERQTQRSKVKATFQLYEPETEAEYTMNQMWLERQKDVDVERNKEAEVRSRLHTWSMKKSRDESEYLRKHEATQLAAGLGVVCQEEYESSHPRRRNLDQRRKEWQNIQQSMPSKTQGPEVEEDDKRSPDIPATPVKEASTGVVVVLKKKKPQGAPGTPVGSGDFKFQPFHPSTHIQQNPTAHLGRVSSSSAINRKMYPRGTLLPQPEPLDPEYRHLHAAMQNRKPPLHVTSFLPEKTQASTRLAAAQKSGSAPSSNQQQEPSYRTPSITSKDAERMIPMMVPSDLRAEQMGEVDRIRALFDKHRLSFSPDLFEKALLVPEDRSALECATNLPLAGARLVSNPLLQARAKTGKTTKKKKKAKGGKKKKSKNDSVSPKKKKK